MRTMVLIFCCLFLFGCGSGNLDYVKNHACEKWEAQGFRCLDYEGYNWGAVLPFTHYGGAEVWHRLKKIPDNGITYSGYIQRWGNELHVYGPTAIDAIRPNNN